MRIDGVEVGGEQARASERAGERDTLPGNGWISCER